MGNRIYLLFASIALLSFLFAVCAGLMLFVRRKRNTAIQAFVWILLFILTVVPIIVPYHLLSLRLYTDSSGGMRIETHIPAESGAARGDFYVSHHTREMSETVAILVLSLWFIAMTASLSFGIASYWDTLQFLMKNSENCKDERILAICAEAKRKAGVHRPVYVRVMRQGLKISPCTAGTWSASVFIGGDYLDEYTDEQLELIFLHELFHVRHNDSALRHIALFATSFHALLPVSAKVRTAVSEDMEYLVDRSVLRCMGTEVRGTYIAVILDIAERNISEELPSDNLFSPASRAGALLMNRYRRMLAEDDRMSARQVLPLCAALALNVCLMSVCLAENPYNLRIDMKSSSLSDALTKHFALADPQELTEEHLRTVYRIDFRCQSVGEDEPPPSVYDCVINEDRAEGDCTAAAYPMESRWLDCSDLALFNDLQTLVMDGGLRPDPGTWTDEAEYAVILRD